MKFLFRTVGATIVAVLASFGRMIVAGAAVVATGAVFGFLIGCVFSAPFSWTLLGAVVAFVSHVWSSAK